MKLCKKCKGLGFAIGKTGEKFGCPDCAGSGRIIEKTLKNEFAMEDLDGTVAFDKETMTIRVCKSCGGLGMFVYGPDDSQPCRDCGGTGRIVLQQIKTEYQLHHLEEFEE